MEENGWFYEIHNENYKIGYKIKKKLFSGKSKYQKLEIFDTYNHGKLMVLDDYIMLTEKDEFTYHEMISHVAICSHPLPKNILIIGGGDGGTVREVLKHNIVEQTILCELDKMVIEESKKFFQTTSCEFDNPKLKIVIEDGFNFLENNKNNFDIILVDSTDPIGEGAKLFEEKFYQLCYSSLKKDGILIFQSETPFYYLKLIKDIKKVLKKYFSIVETYLAGIPMYPSGTWAFGYASKRYKPIENLIESRAKEISKFTRYYNEEIHKASFLLPNFVKKELI